MAVFRDRDKQHFPLKNIQAVVNLFKDQLEGNGEPNLALLSIVLGIVEHNLTVNRNVPAHIAEEGLAESSFPVVDLAPVEALYHRFVCLIRGSIDLTHHDSPYASRELVKRASDVVWAGLCRGSYKDKAHLQSLYVYLTGNKLDCFGLALAVVAACQVLGFADVHLALSEDHAWVVFGPDGTDTAEVTWHGKGNEDKRGQPITAGVSDKSWLYLNGRPVVCCERGMEVAAMVAGINPAINATTDSLELVCLQKHLLWLLHDRGSLDRYPMGLGNLGDLEELLPTPGRPSALLLFHKAIDANRQYYSNLHVYPYTYLGGYYYRKAMFKEALRYWALAAQAISHYNYSREDEEIYKEFLEIANDFIPQIIKLCSETHSLNNSLLGGGGGGPGLLQDAQCYVMLLQFYDGICEWEEGSSTPVLHITWANHLYHSLSKFAGETREAVLVRGGEDEEEEQEEAVEEVVVEAKRARRDRRECSKENHQDPVEPRGRGGGKPGAGRGRGGKEAVLEDKTPPPPLVKVGKAEEGEEDIQSTIQELESKVATGEDSQNDDDGPNPSIADLAKACGESILNPDYLLGMGEPFTTAAASHPVLSAATDTRVDFNEFLSSQSDGSAFPGINLDTMLRPQTPASEALVPGLGLGTGTGTGSGIGTGCIGFRSAKMRGMKKLLLAAKLNANAIKLQVTAQSQVHLKHSTPTAQYGRKRTQRRQ